jgi:hypothetical protein
MILPQHDLDRRELYPFFKRPVLVRILIVTDGSAAFDRESAFGLGRAIDVLRSDPWWYAQFVITTAHRQNADDDAAHPDLKLHKSFRFDNPGELKLDRFDEIWLFGVNRTGDALTDTERAALEAFMDGGGGVFATGDHEDLGAAMCSELKRVRYMRRWKTGGVAGSPPPQSGAKRHDTLREGLTPGFQFSDQSDNVPQPIAPKRYYEPADLITYVRRWAPHPILCGRSGVVDVLPDHMHEGWVVAPTRNNGDFPGATLPEVIATATVLVHATPGVNGEPSDPVETTAKQFGVLGAYDGAREGVGRIVTDATWHHWFNVNLVGFSNGEPSWELIKDYFWNTALWLARKATRQAVAERAVSGLVLLQPFNELDLWKIPIADLGWMARDALGRRATRCAVKQFLFDLEGIDREWREERWPPIPGPDPRAIIEAHRELIFLGEALRRISRSAQTEGADATLDEAACGSALSEAAAAAAKETASWTRELLGSFERAAASLR